MCLGKEKCGIVSFECADLDVATSGMLPLVLSIDEIRADHSKLIVTCCWIRCLNATGYFDHDQTLSRTSEANRNLRVDGQPLRWLLENVYHEARVESSNQSRFSQNGTEGVTARPHLQDAASDHFPFHAVAIAADCISSRCSTYNIKIP